MEPKKVRDFKEMGRKGSATVLARYGVDHFRMLAQKRVDKQRAAKKRLAELEAADSKRMGITG